MDSTNSVSSLQSSGTDDGPYDSRATTSFPFLSNPSPIQPLPPPQLPFDPISAFLPLNPTILWPKNTNIETELYHNNRPTFPPPTPIPPHDPIPPPPPSTAARGPKKRSRATRRAPTTVLNTDTSNFRAMVQEFTGIPTPPFTKSSPFRRKRLDLFATPAPNLRHLFSQEGQSQPMIGSTSSTQSLVHDYQYAAPTSNIFSISSPNFTSLIQGNHKFPAVCSKIQDSAQISSNQNSSGHGDNAAARIGGFPELVSSDRIRPRNNNDNESENGNINYSWRNNVISLDEVHHDHQPGGIRSWFSGTPL